MAETHAGTPSAAVEVPVLAVEGLSVSYRTAAGLSRVVHDVSFTVRPGEVVALVGESGSGKTTTAQAVIGLLAENAHRDAGSILLNGVDIAGWSDKRLETVRGARIGLIPQDPSSSLNPVRTIGAQIAEVLQIHKRGDKATRQARVIELLTRVGLPEPERRATQYPHELSGGMRQRVLIAIAIALRPELIIADEATSALDVTVQKTILDLLDELRAEFGTAILFVTHDLGVAAERAERIVVLQHGRIQEQGETRTVIARPESEYTKRLFADAPSFHLTPSRAQRPPVAPLFLRDAAIADAENPYAVEVEDLVTEFGRGATAFRAVDGVSFRLRRGTTHAIVGESGSGKTTTARAVAGLAEPTSGCIIIDGEHVAKFRGEQRRQLRRRIQLVYQNPFGSLDPRQSVEQIVAEPLRNFGLADRRGRGIRAAELLDLVALPSAVLSRRARELSGGQRQRVAIARALAVNPEILVLDEAVSALDVTVQAQILRLLESLQDELGLSYLFISHDLAVVRQISDTVSVMSRGRAVETGSAAQIFGNPQHEYTQQLLAAVPSVKEFSA
ncbi:glutathione ABC transporter ATP-binding protein [Microterricola viridarii]|uniref:Glutathione ABC transporter ATP-binding protein n=1 Tax=Microterricola viridarii TaxID=412690 RepID=A0A0Y0QA95_9MICO|nr:glutathione ABC transporter ATP-binding protein [Microterricola viridarii]